MNRVIAAAVATVALTSALLMVLALSDLPEEDAPGPDPAIGSEALASLDGPAPVGEERRYRADRPAPAEGVAAIAERPALHLPGALPPLHERPAAGDYRPPMSESREMMGRIEKLMVSIRDEIRAARGDPGRIARALERFHQSTHTDLQRAETLWSAMAPDEQARFHKEMRARLWPVMHEIMGAMDAQGIPVKQVASPRADPASTP